MDADLNQANDYLAHAEGAIKEARSQISLAAGVSVEDLKARQTLAESLGEAHNAISRAKRDLDIAAANVDVPIVIRPRHP